MLPSVPLPRASASCLCLVSRANCITFSAGSMSPIWCRPARNAGSCEDNYMKNMKKEWSNSIIQTPHTRTRAAACLTHQRADSRIPAQPHATLSTEAAATAPMTAPIGALLSTSGAAVVVTNLTVGYATVTSTPATRFRAVNAALPRASSAASMLATRASELSIAACSAATTAS